MKATQKPDAMDMLIEAVHKYASPVVTKILNDYDNEIIRIVILHAVKTHFEMMIDLLDARMQNADYSKISKTLRGL